MGSRASFVITSSSTAVATARLASNPPQTARTLGNRRDLMRPEEDATVTGDRNPIQAHSEKRLCMTLPLRDRAAAMALAITVTAVVFDAIAELGHPPPPDVTLLSRWLHLPGGVPIVERNMATVPGLSSERSI